MTAELQAAGIVACAAIAYGAICVAKAANRIGWYGRTGTTANRLHGQQLEHHADRLAALEAHLARIGRQPGPLAPPRPPERPPAIGGRHDAYRARTAPEWVDTVRMPHRILWGAR